MRASIEAGEALRRVLLGVIRGRAEGGGPGRGRLWMREPGGGALVRYEEVALIGGIEEED